MRLPWQLITSQFLKGIYVAMASVSHTVPFQNRTSAMLTPYTAQRNAPLTGSGFYLWPLFFCLTAHPVGTSDMSITAFALKSRGQQVLKLIVFVQLQDIACLSIKSAWSPLRGWGTDYTKTRSQISSTKARDNWKTDNFCDYKILTVFLKLKPLWGVFHMVVPKRA